MRVQLTMPAVWEETLGATDFPLQERQGYADNRVEDSESVVCRKTLQTHRLDGLTRLMH